MQLLVIALIAIAMFATILAACLQGQRSVTWKRCRHCSWWFSDDGRVSVKPPAAQAGLLYSDYGTCPDCHRKKVDLRKQQPPKDK